MMARIANLAFGIRFPGLQYTALMIKDISSHLSGRQLAGWFVRSAKGFNNEIGGGQGYTGETGDLYEALRKFRNFYSQEAFL